MISLFPSYKERQKQELLNRPKGQTKLGLAARHICWNLNGPARDIHYCRRARQSLRPT